MTKKKKFTLEHILGNLYAQEHLIKAGMTEEKDEGEYLYSVWKDDNDTNYVYIRHSYEKLQLRFYITNDDEDREYTT